MTDKTTPEALQEFAIRKLAAIGPVWASSGLVERRPIEYRSELEDQFVRGFRSAEKRFHTRIAELEAEIAAVGAGGVQALSAAPNGWESVIDEARSGLQDSEPSAFDNSGYRAFAETVLDAVEEGLSALAASPTPPAECITVDEFCPCPCCFGAGVEGTADDYGHTIDVECGECNGSGRDSKPTPPAEQPDLSQLTERGANAWAGVDAQTLRDGTYQQATTTEAVTPKAGVTTGAALGGVYAELPQPDSWFHFTPQYWGNALRDFADHTHALRMEQAAPKAAPGERLTADQARAMVAAMDMNDAVLAGIDADAEPQQEAPKAAPGEPRWWRKRADAIEAQVAATGSPEAMRCYTDMRALLQAVTEAAPECPTCNDHGAVGNILTAEPCPDCTAAPQQEAQGLVLDGYTLPSLPDPDLRDVGTKPQEIFDFLRGYATEYARKALRLSQTAPAPLSESIDQLERELAIIGVVGAIDGCDVVRRESVLEIARRAALAAQGGKA